MLGCLLVAASTASAENPVALRASELPKAWTDEEARALVSTLAAQCLPVRVVEPLPRGSRPKEFVVDGVAVWLQLPGELTGRFVTTFSLVARASRVEVWHRDGWRPVTAVHGTLLYDLAELVPTEPLALDAKPAPVATVPPSDPVLFSVAPVAPQANPTAVAVGMGGPQPEELRYYGRANTVLVRGYPVVDRQGRIQGLLSTPSPDGEGVLLIGSDRLAEWHEAWERLDGVGGLKPRTTKRSEQLNAPGRR